MKEIVMFTSSTCPHCKTAKRYLDEMGFKYIEKNVGLDKNAQQEMISRKLMGVPSFIIGNETIVGLDKNKIEALLDYTVERCPSCGQKSRVPKGKGKVKITCKSCGEAYTLQTKSM
jgi:glutaredoxin